MAEERAILEEWRRKWGEGIFLQDSTLEIPDLSEYVRYKTLEYKVDDLQDDDLWGAFRDDFPGFTVETFKNCNLADTQKLRLLLRANGVWVLKDNHTTIAQSLYNTLTEHIQSEWPEAEIKEYLNSGKKFNSARIQHVFLGGSTSTNPPEEDGFKVEPRNGFKNKPERDYGRAIANLAKLYTEEDKYCGSRNDNFDYKLIIFHDNCDVVGIPQSLRNKAYPRMLRGLARQHYFINRMNNPRTPTLEQLCDATRNYFGGRRGMLERWNTLTLRKVMSRAENSEKTTLDCLELLILELRQVQIGLDPDLQTEKLLHCKVIDACRDIPACKPACFRPSSDLAKLFNELREAIAIFEPSTEDSDTLFTDRRCHKQSPPPRTPSSRSRTHNHGNRTYAEPHGRQAIDKKRCFVCGKKGCWSNKHSQEEQEESKRRYGREMARDYKYYKNNTQQYVAEYEGMEESDECDSDLDEEPTGETIKTLVAHVSPSPNPQEQTELFLASFGSIPPETVTKITNNF